MSRPTFDYRDWANVDMSGCSHWTTHPELTPAVRFNILIAAMRTVWTLGGQRWATGRKIIRPNTSCGCYASCSHNRCGSLDVIPLTHYASPFISVERVFIDTTDLVELTDYWVNGRHELVPITDGELIPWPTQDLNTVSGDYYWGIEVNYGEVPPELALIAAADLACIMSRRYLNLPCDIPEAALAVTREGVTVRMAQGFAAVPSVKMMMDTYARRATGRRLVDPAKFRGGIYEMFGSDGDPAVTDFAFTGDAGTWAAANAPGWLLGISGFTPTLPLTITKGSSFAETITFVDASSGVDVPLNITTFTYEAQIRDADGNLVIDLTCTVTNGAAGQMVVSLNPVQTATLAVGSSYRWDLEETNGSDVTTLFPHSPVFVVDDETV